MMHFGNGDKPNARYNTNVLHLYSPWYFRINLLCTTKFVPNFRYINGLKGV